MTACNWTYLNTKAVADQGQTVTCTVRAAYFGRTRTAMQLLTMSGKMMAYSAEWLTDVMQGLTMAEARCKSVFRHKLTCQKFPPWRGVEPRFRAKLAVTAR